MITHDVLHALVHEAAKNWTGRDFDTSPADLALYAGMAFRAIAHRDLDAAGWGPEFTADARAEVNKWLRKMRDTFDGSACFWPANGSYTSQQLDREWRALRRDLDELDGSVDKETFEDIMARVDALDLAEREAIESDAIQAAEQGWNALAYFEEGDLYAALEAAREACRIEDNYGDCPVWRPVREELEQAIAERAGEDES